VKGYATHERELFENVTKARAATVSPEALAHPAQSAKAEGDLQETLKSLFMVAEAYPQLQANQNFLALQQELTDTEDKIMASRRFYNGGVRELNIKIKQFPQNLFVSGLGFAAREFFEVADAAAIAEPPQVKF
jgi:LemA protein